jgi:hypothetical protein
VLELFCGAVGNQHRSQTKGEEHMIDSKKLQYYTMAHRLRGFAEGVEDDRKYEALVGMLNKAASPPLWMPPRSRSGMFATYSRAPASHAAGWRGGVAIAP